MRALITGGAGFIGSAACRAFVLQAGWTIVAYDKTSYAASGGALAALADNPRFRLVEGDINDRARLSALFAEFKPDCVLHCAAETHVDRSIDDPTPFIAANVVGALNVLEAARGYWRTMHENGAFRFVHLSTDEVFGALGETGAFDEATAYAPNSPYAASKAGADHLVRAWRATYGLPTIVVNASNNYGPFQFPEKLIPLTIANALESEPIAVYGDGAQVRDWLHVEDHVEALRLVLTRGAPGETYVVGGRSERRNLEIVHAICDRLDALAPANRPRRELIRFVADRPGHDRRYAVDCSRIERELGWRRTIAFEEGLRRTIEWGLANRAWWAQTRARYAGARLGLDGG